jgi:adenosylcobinamide-phosphate synthase
MVFVLAMLVALAVDCLWGEPPVRLHPVVWMGNYLNGAGAWVQRHTRQLPGESDYKAFWLGALVWIAGAAMVSGVACGLERAVLWACSRMFALWALGLEPSISPFTASLVSTVFAGVLLGLLLKPLLAWALLRSEVLAVEQALSGPVGSLAAGRERLRWLVSRDVAQLTEPQVRESAIETLAENLNDSVVAPLFWFALLGLPGAALYRFANTADAMWGYRGVYQGRNWEWAGKWAARADDVLSWVPARLTALMLALAAGGVSFGKLRHEAHRTASPNSGWPMSAMALA